LLTCHHAPAAVGNGLQQFRSPGHDRYTLVIFGLAFLDSHHFRFRIQMRRQPANHFHGSHAVRDFCRVPGIYIVFLRPPLPLPGYGTCGVDENAVKIEQNG
jgi:hypothetical protein